MVNNEKLLDECSVTDISNPQTQNNKGPSNSEKAIHPLDKTNIISQHLALWVNQCIKISQKNAWQETYTYNIAQSDRVESYETEFFSQFLKKRSLMKTIFAHFAYPILLVIFINILNSLFTYGISWAIFFAIESLKIDPKSPNPDAQTIQQKKTFTCLMILIVIFSLLTILIKNQGLFYSQRLSQRLRSALTSAILLKSFKCSLMNANKFDEFRVLNLVTADINKFELGVMQFFL